MAGSTARGCYAFLVSVHFQNDAPIYFQFLSETAPCLEYKALINCKLVRKYSFVNSDQLTERDNTDLPSRSQKRMVTEETQALSSFQLQRLQPFTNFS
jgi:hypothetical protein